MLIILIRPKLGHSGIPRMTKVRRPSFSGERYRVIIIRLRSVHILRGSRHRLHSLLKVDAPLDLTLVYLDFCS